MIVVAKFMQPAVSKSAAARNAYIPSLAGKHLQTMASPSVLGNKRVAHTQIHYHATQIHDLHTKGKAVSNITTVGNHEQANS